MTGQRPLSEWEDYLATVQQIGLERVLELYQAAYDRWEEAGAAN